MGAKRKKVEIYGVMHYRCSQCHEFKPAFEYYVNSQSPDNVHFSCRKCMIFLNEIKNDRLYNIKPPSEQTYSEEYKRTLKEIMIGLGFDVTKNVSQQFYQRIKEKYNVDLS